MFDPQFYKTYVPGIGNQKAKIVLVGQAPWTEEVDRLTPFVGQSGKLLNELLASAGINRNDCWVTNVSKYAVPLNPKEGRKLPFEVRAANVGIDLDQQIRELQTEISAIQPNVVIPLGDDALWAITGHRNITDYRGSILNGWGFKLVPTFHPANILYSEGDYWKKQIIRFDLKRARAQAEFKEFKLPVRNLSVIQNSGQLYDFFQRYPSGYPAIDIEALGCIPICIGIAYNKSEGITVPLWNINGISTISDSDLATLWCMLDARLRESEVRGANFGFDRDKLKRLGFLIKKLKSDVMLKAFACNPELPKNLAFLTSICTEEPFYKNEGMYDGELKDLLIGCARDSCVTVEVDDALDKDIDELNVRDYYENFLLPLHNVYHVRKDNTAIEQVGFRVDEKKRDELMHKYIKWDEELRYKLFKIAGKQINCNSWQQVSKLIYEEWKLPHRSGTGEEDLTSLINSPNVKNPLHKEGLGLILEDRRVRKTISSYVYALPDYDGRMRTSYFLCLETGRSATQQQEPPIRPSEPYVDRNESGAKVTKRQARGAAFQTMTKHGDIGPEIRKMYIADEGHIFLQADSSQAEARVIFKLADDEQALRDIDEHDYHALTASWFFGGKEEDYSKRLLGYESPIRFAGKTLRHACHLGASARRATTEVNTQARKFKIDFQLAEKQAKQAIEIFHKRQPKIKQVFQKGIQDALERNRRLLAPLPYGVTQGSGGCRIFYERWGDELFRQAYSYIPQRTVSENTKGAALRIRGSEDICLAGRAEWIKILVEAHDALLVMVPIERKYEAAQILKEELERPIDFSTCSLPRSELVIPCEVEEGYNYKDLSKFKWIDAPS